VVAGILRVAAEQECDAIIVGGLNGVRLGRSPKNGALQLLLSQADRPVLVCP
jgi:hypothetical protein